MDAAVIFDVDGTLVDSTYLHALAWQRAFAARRHVIPAWRIHRVIGMGGDKVVAELAGEEIEEREGDDLRQGWEDEYERLRGELTPLPGAADLVRRVGELGLKVALASSGKDDFVEQAVDLLGIRDVIDGQTTSDDAENSKPDPDILVAALDRVGCRRAVMVGDSPYDVEAAAKLGLACVALRTGGFGADELRAAGAVAIVDEPADAMELDWASLVRDVRPSP